jgi:hypothetical protein
MNNEFKKINNNNITRYVLEDGSSGGASSGSTSAGSISSFAKPMGGMQRRAGDNLISQENKKSYKISHKPKNPVAKAHQTVGTGSGQHKDKTKVLPRQEKHKKSADMTMENFNAEYDDEAGMAYGSLHTLKRAVDGLMNTIDDEDNLPEWCQEKISLAEDYLVTVWDYLQSEKEQGVAEGIFDRFKKKPKKESYSRQDFYQWLDKVQEQLASGEDIDEVIYNLELSLEKIYTDDVVAQFKGQIWDSLDLEMYEQGVAEGSDESYIIMRTDKEGKQDVFAKFDTYEKAQKELDACLAHPLHTKYKQKFELKRKGQQGLAEGWQDETQDLEDWAKEVNKKLYRAHESQRPALARQLSKLEQKNFGSSLNQGGLTELVHSTLKALRSGGMVHYDPQSVGQMPFGNIVGDDARLIAASGMSQSDNAGYQALKRAGILDTIQQFLQLRDLANSKGEDMLKYSGMDPVAGWMQFIKDTGWSKDDASLKEKITVVNDPKKATGIQTTGGITHGSVYSPGKQGVEKGGQVYGQPQWQMPSISSPTYTPGKPLPQSLQQKLDGKPNTGRAVDAKGRTQQQWLKLVKFKFPDAKVMVSKMIDGPCFAMLADGRKLSWNKVEQDVAEDDYTKSVASKLAEKLDPNAEPEVWVQDFQKANPNKYHQFKNKTPQKKAQMAVAARRDARLKK